MFVALREELAAADQRTRALETRNASLEAEGTRSAEALVRETAAREELQRASRVAAGRLDDSEARVASLERQLSAKDEVRVGSSLCCDMTL